MLSVRTAALTAFLVGFAVHAGNLGNGFAWDDDYLIEGNPSVHGFDQAASWFTEPWSAGSSLGSGRDQNALYWRPLAQASYALDWTLGGGSPVPFHVTNDLLHALASALVALLAAAVVRRSSVAAAPALAALGAGLAFAVHPVHSEAVNLATYRTTLLADAAVLLGMVLWAQRLARGGLRVRDGFLLAAVLAAGVMGKESAVMLPAFLVLTEWALGEAGLPGWRRVAPYLPVAAAALVYLVIHQSVTGPPKLDYFATSSRWEVFVTMQTVVALYARLLVFPWPLTSFYDWSIMPIRDDLGHPDAVLGLTLLVLALAALAYALWRRAPATLLSLGLLLGALLPYAHFLTFFDLCGERFLYLASAGPCIGLGVFLARPLRSAIFARTCALALGVVFAGVSATRTAVFDSSHTMLLDMVDGYPRSFNAHVGLAKSFAQRGAKEDAVRHGLVALSIMPDFDPAALRAAAFIGESRGQAAQRAFLEAEVQRRGLSEGPLVEALRGLP